MSDYKLFSWNMVILRGSMVRLALEFIGESMSIPAMRIWPWTVISAGALCWKRRSVARRRHHSSLETCANTARRRLRSLPPSVTHAAIFHSWTRLAFALLHGLFSVCLQLMLQFYVEPLLEYHWVITLTLVISVTHNCNCLGLFWQGPWKDLFPLSCHVWERCLFLLFIYLFIFSCRHTLFHDKAENAEGQTGVGMFFYANISIIIHSHKHERVLKTNKALRKQSMMAPQYHNAIVSFNKCK